MVEDWQWVCRCRCRCRQVSSTLSELSSGVYNCFAGECSALQGHVRGFSSWGLVGGREPVFHLGVPYCRMLSLANLIVHGAGRCDTHTHTTQPISERPREQQMVVSLKLNIPRTQKRFDPHLRRIWINHEEQITNGRRGLDGVGYRCFTTYVELTERASQCEKRGSKVSGMGSLLCGLARLVKLSYSSRFLPSWVAITMKETKSMRYETSTSKNMLSTVD